jgi:hypothetical protein
VASVDQRRGWDEDIATVTDSATVSLVGDLGEIRPSFTFGDRGQGRLRVLRLAEFRLRRPVTDPTSKAVLTSRPSIRQGSRAVQTIYFLPREVAAVDHRLGSRDEGRVI